MSPDGGDAIVVREYDLAQQQFVGDGFNLPLSKTNIAWIDADNLLVATNFGEGSMTQASYPRILKRWHRGTPLSSATTVLESRVDQMGMNLATTETATPGKPQILVNRNLDFDSSENFRYDADSQQLQSLPYPANATLTIAPTGEVLVSLVEAWSLNGITYSPGTLLLIPNSPRAAPVVIFQPSPRRFLHDWQFAGGAIYLEILDNVQSELVRVVRSGTAWVSQPIAIPPMGSVGIHLSDAADAELVFSYQSYLIPSTIYRLPAGAS